MAESSSARAVGPSAASGDRLGVHLKRAEQQLIAVKSAVLRPFDLTVPQYSALRTVANGSRLSSAQVARACLVTPQTIGSVLAGLADRGLVDRRASPSHSGVLAYTSTRKGRRIAEAADAATLAIETRLDDLFDLASRAAFIAALDTVSAELESMR